MTTNEHGTDNKNIGQHNAISQREAISAEASPEISGDSLAPTRPIEEVAPTTRMPQDAPTEHIASADQMASADQLAQTTPIMLPADETPTAVFTQAKPTNRNPYVHDSMEAETVAIHANTAGSTGASNQRDTANTTDTPGVAARDQRNAATGYAQEAARNGYPGGGVPPQNGDPYAAYPGWNRNSAPQASQPTQTVVYDKTGVSGGTVIWGVIVTLAAAVMIAPFVVGDFALDSTFWLRVATFTALALGAALIIGAIISGVRGQKRRSTKTRTDTGADNHSDGKEGRG